MKKMLVLSPDAGKAADKKEVLNRVKSFIEALKFAGGRPRTTKERIQGKEYFRRGSTFFEEAAEVHSWYDAWDA